MDKSKSNHIVLKSTWLDTPLGAMLCITDDRYLYLLEFVGRRGLEREIERLCKRLNCMIIPGDTVITSSIKKELESYFAGKLFTFKTPLYLLGSDFQKQVWMGLMQIKPGDTKSYLELAIEIGHPKSHRALANANGANQLAIVIPCHRVINSDGALGGYGGGIAKKEWLLLHEKKYCA